MDEQNLLENLIDECDSLTNNLKDEYLKLNQEIQELYFNSNIHVNKDINDKVMFNQYPTPVEAPFDVDENILNTLSINNEFPDSNHTSLVNANNSSTIDPISISNSETKSTIIDSGMINEELLAMMANLVENAPLGNICNGIDIDDMNQNLFTMQENSVKSTIPVDVSIESIIAEFKNNNVSFLETTSNNENMLNECSLEKLLSIGSNLVPKNEIDTYFLHTVENDVSKT